jgi:hypothetical protein
MASPAWDMRDSAAECAATASAEDMEGVDDDDTNDCRTTGNIRGRGCGLRVRRGCRTDAGGSSEDV